MAISTGTYMTASNILGNNGLYLVQTYDTGKRFYFKSIGGEIELYSYTNGMFLNMYIALFKLVNGSYDQIDLCGSSGWGESNSKTIQISAGSYRLDSGSTGAHYASDYVGFKLYRSKNATRRTGYYLRGIKSDFSGYESGLYITADLVNAGRVCTY